MAWTLGQFLQAGWYFNLGQFRAAMTRNYVVTTNLNGGVTTGALAAQLWNDYSPLILNCLSAPAELRGLVLYAPPYSGTVADAYDPGPGQFGNGGNASLPPSVSGKIRLEGLQAYVRRTGFLYMPFPSEDDNDANARPTAGYVANLQALANQFLVASSAVQVAGAPPPLPKRTDIRAYMFPHSSVNPNFIIGSSARGFWSTQRRRAQLPMTNNWPFG